MHGKYVDANIFLYAALYEDRRADACRKVLEGIVARRYTACTSVLTWDEFTYVAGQVCGRAQAVALGEKFLRFPHLRFLNCDTAVLARAQALMATTNLKPRDALHAATALNAELAHFVSEDRDFDAVPGLQRQNAAMIEAAPR